MSRREERRRRKRSAWMREIVLIVVIALVASFLVKTFVMRAFYIPSSSMEPTLQIQDRVMANQLPWAHPDHGDIVVFDDPGGWLSQALIDSYKPNPVLEFVGLQPSDAGQQLIKRVIGVGGDTVKCCDGAGRIELNGVGLDEPYLNPGEPASVIEFYVTVPAGHYWVMGDNRSNSADSRYHGDSPGGPFVAQDQIVGQVFLRTYPFSRSGWMNRPAEVYEPAAQ